MDARLGSLDRVAGQVRGQVGASASMKALGRLLVPPIEVGKSAAGLHGGLAAAKLVPLSTTKLA